MPIQTRFFSEAVLLIPDNVEQVIEVEELVSLFRHQILDLPKLTPLYKTLKAARLRMVNKVILNYINIEFLVVDIRKK